MYNEQVLLGSLLGDGCLTFSKRNVNPLYAECHSEKQLDYLKWKNQFFDCKIKQRNTYLKKTNKIYNEYYFRTGSKAFLLPYYHLFYKKGKKSVSKQILNKLKPLAIAVWYCDDGSYSYYNNNSKLCVAGFDYKEKQLISDYFSENFGIHFKLQKEYIYLGANDTKKFLSIIWDYVPDCMGYKLGMDIKKKYIQREKNKLRCKQYWHRNKQDHGWLEKKTLKGKYEYINFEKYPNEGFLFKGDLNLLSISIKFSHKVDVCHICKKINCYSTPKDKSINFERYCKESRKNKFDSYRLCLKKNKRLSQKSFCGYYMDFTSIDWNKTRKDYFFKFDEHFGHILPGLIQAHKDRIIDRLLDDEIEQNKINAYELRFIRKCELLNFLEELKSHITPTNVMSEIKIEGNCILKPYWLNNEIREFIKWDKNNKEY